MSPSNNSDQSSQFSFDFTQTLFLFSWLSNASAETKGTSDQLAKFTRDGLLGNGTPLGGVTPPNGLLTNPNFSLAGKWSLAWGPGVFEFYPNNKKADNTAFAVFDSSTNTYVIAIAGTDPSAMSDWFYEDLNVNSINMVDWDSFDATSSIIKTTPANSSNRQITYGTAVGVQALMNGLFYSDQGDGVGQSQSLASFLLSLKKKGAANVIFTGHSLGGALAPTCALWYHNYLCTDTSKGTNPTVYHLSVAGPTPGNCAFRDQLDTRLPLSTPSNLLGTLDKDNKVKSLNQNVYCFEDLVPHAWQYIYSDQTTDQVPYADVLGPFFTKSKDDKGGTILETNMGVLSNADVLAASLNLVQGTGKSADLKQSIDPNFFQVQFPFSSLTMSNGNVVEVTQNGPSTDPYNALNKDAVISFLGNIGIVHIWSYGQQAFNINIDAFKEIGLCL